MSDKEDKTTEECPEILIPIEAMIEEHLGGVVFTSNISVIEGLFLLNYQKGRFTKSFKIEGNCDMRLIYRTLSISYRHYLEKEGKK